MSYTEFLSGGPVGYIPAGTKKFQLASFGQNSVVSLNFNSIGGLNGFEFTLSGNTYSFPETAQNTLLSGVSDTQELAKYLNTVIQLRQEELKLMGIEGRKNVTKKFDVEVMCDSNLREYKKLLKN